MTARRRHVIREVAVLRLLADPLKLRIFEALRDVPASPHELAARFGLKPTALYHHFARLAAARLIEVAERRRRRGVIERLYRPSAKQLVVDRALVRGPRTSRTVATVLATASAILQVTGEDIHTAALDPSCPIADRTRAELATVVVRTTPARAKQLMRELRALIETATRFDGTGTTRARLTVALIPVTSGQPTERVTRGPARRRTTRTTTVATPRKVGPPC